MSKKTKKQKTNKTKIIYYFLKGIIMGIFDLVPGISGGTIALITKIYEKLIKEINNFFELMQQILVYNKKQIQNKYKKTDMKFLVLLVLGIFTGITISIFIMSHLLDNYFMQTMSIITGIILTSGFLLIKQIYKNTNQIIFGFLGLIIGILISILTPLTGHSFNYVQIFFFGAITINAMMLPGISGALILLILGGYEFMINVLKNIDTEYLFVIAFISGALLGLLTFAKIIKYILEKHKDKTMIFLALLMIGATTKPILEIMQTNKAELGLPLIILTVTITYFVLRQK